jgi:hypothetical protein
MSSSGAIASETWLRTLGFVPPVQQRWHVEITLDVGDARPSRDFDEATATHFHLDIYSDEWGVFFCHDGGASWIRVADAPAVHRRDDHHVLARMPSLDNIGALLRDLERTHAIRFMREHATVHSNLPHIEPAVRAWLLALS